MRFSILAEKESGVSHESRVREGIHLPHMRKVNRQQVKSQEAFTQQALAGSNNVRVQKSAYSRIGNLKTST